MNSTNNNTPHFMARNRQVRELRRLSRDVRGDAWAGLDALSGLEAGSDAREKSGGTFGALADITKWYESKLKEKGVL